MNLYLLIDCNNFFVSCERVFNPALAKHPVVILSSNDGCIVSRSNEAKKLGIPMGAPYYQYRELCEKNKVIALSSNFQLYGDFSNRVMYILQQTKLPVEIYSVDEAFLQVNLTLEQAHELAQQLRIQMLQWIGIPISVGIAPTKTLAKLANDLAKQQTQENIFSLLPPACNPVLQQTPIEAVWGIGNNLAQGLRMLGIANVFDLCNSEIALLRKRFSVAMERMIYELRGIDCYDLATEEVPRKNILVSRSFGKPVFTLTELKQAVSYHVARACLKLREQGSKAGGIEVFVRTNYFKLASQQYSNRFLQNFPEHTQDTRIVTEYALQALAKIFVPGYSYHKAGVYLVDLVPEDYQQTDLFNPSPFVTQKSKLLMETVDNINTLMGDGTLFLAAEGVNHAWRTRSGQRSPRYTTCWDELVRVY